jgi:N-dimethylarginine dimethylaminohydrolase
MIATNAETYKKLNLRATSNAARPKNIIMVDPEHFRIAYAINPYMADAAGNLNKIDVAKARHQWRELKTTYEKLGFTVSVIKGDAALPDMVFAANQSFSFIDAKTDKKSVVLSRMRSEFRRPEVKYFESFYKEHGFNVHHLETTGNETFFEGNGDALIHWPHNLVWGGYGERTSPDVYKELSTRFGFNIAMLKLVNKSFYHLDTCFSILNEKTVVIQKEAFDADGLKMIHAGFENVILTELEENLSYFACNCHSPDGHHVITQTGTKKFRPELEKHGFKVIEVETGEYIKSGGSVFCMKMMVP